ncbi:amidohydrolase family protein [Actinomadura madurae]|nr:amidohydrolase family protein [Actinomadura madurae]
MHINQYAARSALPALERAGKTMGHWKARITTADEVASARLAVLDLLRSGHTGFVDPGTVYEPDAVAETASHAGVRAWLTDPYVADRGHDLAASHPELFGGGFLRRWPRTTDEAMARVGGQLFRNREDGLVRGFVGLYGEASDSPELYRYAAEVARDNGVTVQEHLGYTQSRYIAEEKRYGRTPRPAARRRRPARRAHLVRPHEPGHRRGRRPAGPRGGIARVVPVRADAGALPAGRRAADARTVAPRDPGRHRQRHRAGGGLDALGTLAVSASTMAGDAVRPAEVLRMRGARRGPHGRRPRPRRDPARPPRRPRPAVAGRLRGPGGRRRTGDGRPRRVRIGPHRDRRRRGRLRGRPPTRFDAADAVRHARASVRRLLKSIG